jgi:hypothetical protein
MAHIFISPHPGEILCEWLGDMSVTDTAQHLGVGHIEHHPSGGA